jgi:DNA-binding winged helix-turn-helix (wHTH) protein
MPGRIYRFGSFRLDEQSRQLLSESKPVAITPKVFDTLLFLVSNAGRTISRDELIQAVWPDTFVEEGNLNYNMPQLRKILGEHGPGDLYVQTIPKVGYRFVGRVETPETDVPGERIPGAGIWKTRYVVIGSAAILLAAGVVFWATRPATLERRLGQISGVSRITGYPGDEQAPSLSPDGEQVAFSWNGGNRSKRSIYITRIGATTPLQLTNSDSEDDDPAWSPDGSQIAFIRWYDTMHSAIVLVPALGGPERKIYAGRFMRSEYPHARPMLAWSPDGKSIAFAAAGESGNSGLLHLLSLETGKSQILVPRAQQAGLDSSPAFSPNGEWLAYTHYYGMENAQMMVQRLGVGFTPRGEPLTIAGAGQSPRSPSWSPDSRGLVFCDYTRIIEWQPGPQYGYSTCSTDSSANCPRSGGVAAFVSSPQPWVRRLFISGCCPSIPARTSRLAHRPAGSRPQ